MVTDWRSSEICPIIVQINERDTRIEEEEEEEKKNERSMGNGCAVRIPWKGLSSLHPLFLLGR
jgi:hypothetical protein